MQNDKQMKTILLLTYQISPYKGSESSVGWNYVVNMSRDNRLVVIYGFDKIDIQHYLSLNSLPNVLFVHIESASLIGHGLIHDINYNFNYRKWHKKAYKKGKEIISNEKIDLIHYLNPIGFKEPSFMWKLDKPYIWGPMQGVENRPFKLYKALSIKEKINALGRRIVHNGMLRLMFRVKIAVRKADVIFAATPNTQKQLESIYNKTSIYLPENGILNLIWVGRIDERKALGILLESLTKLKSKSFCLNVVGSGPKLEILNRFAKINGLVDKIVWHGQIDRAQVQQIFKRSHLHIITSLGEGNPTIIWEAMANAIPTMSLDHCGMSGVICDKCGIKIPIRSFSQVVDDIAIHISNIIEDPKIIQKLSKGVIECSEKYMWNEKRIQIFNEAYENAILNYKNRNS